MEKLIQSSEETRVADEPKEKKQYEKPAIVFERPLEALAATCVPVNPGKAGGTCTVTFS